MHAEQRTQIAGLRAILGGVAGSPLTVVVLHGREMEAADLSPFAASLGVAARFVFPDAPLPGGARGRSWWPVDAEARARARAHGPADLHALDPAGRAEARALLAGLVRALAAESAARVALVGFSQGGMLAMDYALHEPRPAALALLSSSRIAAAEWAPRLPRLQGLPVLVSHGREDRELAFSAGEGLRDAAQEGGAAVTWVPFDGGHEIPLPVWRALRRWLLALGPA